MKEAKKATEKYLLGLDIGNYALKAVQLVAGKTGYSVSHSARELLPRTLPKEGRDACIAEAVQRIFSDGKFKKGPVSLVLPAQEACTRVFTIPEMSEDEVPEAVKWASKRYIAYPLDEMVLSYAQAGHVYEQSAKTLKIVFLGIHKSMFEKYVKMVRDLGYRLARVHTGCFALGTIVHANRLSQKRAVAVISVGYSGTDVSIFSDDQLVFTRNIAEGGKGFDEAIVEQVSLVPQKKECTPEEAEELKKTVGIILKQGTEPEPQARELAASRALANHLDRMVRELQLSFSHFKQISHGGAVDGVVLAGAGANMQNMAKVLSDKLNIAVEKLSLPSNITCEEGFDAGTFAAAVGSCISGDDSPNLISNIDTAMKSKFASGGRTMRKMVTAFAGLFVAVLLVLGAISIYYKVRLGFVDRALGRLQPQTQELDQLQQEIIQIRKKRTVSDTLYRVRANVVKALVTLSGVSVPADMRIKKVEVTRSNESVQEIRVIGEFLSEPDANRVNALNRFLAELGANGTLTDLTPRIPEGPATPGASEFEIRGRIK